MIAALGVVFGDIGTSPLYAFKETMNPEHGIPFSPDSVLGLLSLIFWGLMFVVTLKYVVFVLRADHDGEGGILALQALARSAVGGPQRTPHRASAIRYLTRSQLVHMFVRAIGQHPDTCHVFHRS